VSVDVSFVLLEGGGGSINFRSITISWRNIRFW
jgi:hypothetical protein